MPLERTPLDQLATVFEVAGTGLADVNGWLEYPISELMERREFVSLIQAVPGLKPCFVGLLELATRNGALDDFWRVIQHTLRALVYHATQSGPVPYETAVASGRGIYAMALHRSNTEFGEALEFYLSAQRQVTELQPGLLPYLLLWHDGFGLKGIGSRANHEARVANFLEAWEIPSLVIPSGAAQLTRSLAPLISLAIKYPLLQAIGFIPTTGTLFFHTWKFWRESRYSHPYLLTDDGLKEFLALQLAFSVLDVSAIREPGSLRNPRQVLAWVDLQYKIIQRINELHAMSRRYSAEKILRHDLTTAGFEDETPQVLASLFGQDTGAVLDLHEAARKWLPRIVDYSYFIGIFRLLRNTGNTKYGISLLEKICQRIEKLTFTGWVSLRLDRDYVKLGEESSDHIILELLTRDEALDAVVRSMSIRFTSEYEVDLHCSFSV